MQTIKKTIIRAIQIGCGLLVITACAFGMYALAYALLFCTIIGAAAMVIRTALQIDSK